MSILNRGFRTLEILIAKGDAMSFSDINAALGVINRASLSKLLKELVKLEYISKSQETGLYSYGRRTAMFLCLQDKSRKEYLITTHRDLMMRIAREFDVTALLFERSQNSLLCIWKEKTQASINMQPVGQLTEHLEMAPWMIALYASDNTLYEKVKDNMVVKAMDRFRKDGFGFEDQILDKHNRRLGFAIRDIKNEIIGVLGIGGTTLHMTDSNIKQIIDIARSIRY